MRVVHEGHEIASTVEVADSLPARMRGLMLRRSVPEGFALVFPFDRAARRSVHMLFVRFPIDVLWLVEGETERVERLRPWTGFAWATADTIVELPARATDGVEPGDSVRIVDD